MALHEFRLGDDDAATASLKNSPLGQSQWPAVQQGPCESMYARATVDFDGGSGEKNQ
jgi:hypothetical protein